MNLKDLTPEQVQRYFEARLPGQTFAPSGKNLMARCPFHEDRKASLSLNFPMGVWNCHAGCGAGGLRDFEKKISNCDNHTAVANIAEILGLRFSGLLAWWLWRGIYLAKLPGFPKKVRVALDWALDLFFSKNIVQLPTMRATSVSDTEASSSTQKETP